MFPTQRVSKVLYWTQEVRNLGKIWCREQVSCGQTHSTDAAKMMTHLQENQDSTPAPSGMASAEPLGSEES